ncbi:hypothetical protein LG409_04620 [Halomonas sp. NyZ770]|uniref:hypothetical protein n=1 Tax=Halomonas sp. NyZ770 TaxID=2883106 RepID=UPI001D0BD66F|nr:hypothetical protein [Halomonas sp. NyZ770]UDM08194.1 hypothetical protein LG409_04620 [Halomonas sp. NyZ770]
MMSVDMLEAGLALCLVAVALACLLDRHLLRTCRLFLLFTLLMSLAWWQWQAPWLGLMELVLGGALTGGSFFYALKAFPSAHPEAAHYDRVQHGAGHVISRGLLALAWSVMIGAALRYLLPDMAYSLSEHPLMLAAVVMVSAAMGAFALHRHWLRRLMAFNVLGSGVFLLLVGMAGPLPNAQALIGVGLLIAWLGTLLGVLLIRHLLQLEGVSALVDEPSDSQATREASQ